MHDKSVQNKENFKRLDSTSKGLEVKNEVNGDNSTGQPPPTPPQPTQYPSAMNHPNIYLTYGKFGPDTTEVKKQDVFIKKEYLPAPSKMIKLEKTRDDITRSLNFNSAASSNGYTNGNCSDSGTNHQVNGLASQSPVKDGEEVKVIQEPNIFKEEPKNNGEEETSFKAPISSSISSKTNDKVSSSSSSSYKTEDREKRRDKERSSSSSSRHKSSRHSSSSRSSRDCSRCYRRSKIKRSNIGIQCRRDKILAPTFTMPPQLSTPSRIPIANRDLNCTRVGLDGLKYGKFFRIEVHPNGGASFVHLYQDEISALTPSEMDELVQEFFKVCFAEDENGFAHHVMGIVHDAAAYIPDLLEHMAENYAHLAVKAGVLGRNNDIETLTMQQYYEQVAKHYSEGTIRYGPLHQISLVGKVHEEVGGYFPDLLARIEANPFLNQV